MKFLSRLFSRVVLVSLAIAIQLAWLFVVAFVLSDIYLPFAILLNLISIAATVAIINRYGNPEIKLAWIVPILCFPLFGGLIYFISSGKRPKRNLRRALDKAKEITAEQYQTNYHPEPTDIRGKDRYIWGQCNYIMDHGFPIYRDTKATYYDTGKAGWNAMINDLKRAEKFIFLEYFILAPGKMWGTVLDIIKEKKAAGVDVRVIYDDMGSISVLPRHYNRELERMGIPCVRFNPYRPVYSVVMNNRDHRKILVIDGKVGYTGGSNLADEYIGEMIRFGEWKDNFLRLEGEGVRSMTLMFLEMWYANRPAQKSDRTGDETARKEAVAKADIGEMTGKDASTVGKKTVKSRRKATFRVQEDVTAFMPPADASAISCPGLVLPYGNSPVDKSTMAGDIYLNLINQATEYVYIFTPYLIIDHEMSRALCMAAGRGVDVRVVVPAIPDKKSVYHLTQSYFPKLIDHGVVIYKYTPGFLHSKCFVVDDRLAVVGTINMDYRSLIQHFENACLFVDHPVVKDVRADFERTFPRCEVVQKKEPRFNMLYDIYLAILRVLAPML